MGRNPFNPSSAPLQLDLPVIGSSRRTSPAAQRAMALKPAEDFGESQSTPKDRSLVETVVLDLPPALVQSVVTGGMRIGQLAGQMARTLFGSSRR